MTTRVLSERQAEILRFIGDFHAERHYAPTHREITAGCGISSTSVTSYNVEILRRARLILIEPGMARTIRLTEKGWQTLEAEHA